MTAQTDSPAAAPIDTAHTSATPMRAAGAAAKSGNNAPSSAAPVRAIAFFLPQYHPIPENDEWWGAGFTEWTNVVKARSLFEGHYQPHLPADLGFYDLRVAETRAAQAELAREHGIFGFCYYHYWFNGRRLLHRPVDEILATGQPQFPFCLCWANENWTRAWDGGARNILLAQDHSTRDDEAHMRHLCRAFRDERYIRIEGKPLFLVYRASLLPAVRQTVETWRDVARREGVGELYLCQVQSFPTEQLDPRNWGFDAAVEFAPDWGQLGARVRVDWISRARYALRRRLFGVPSPFYEHFVYDYRTLAERMLAQPAPPYVRFPGVTPMWDNSARRKREAVILRDSTPELYERWLREVVSRVRQWDTAPRLCFVNAWNEWAEGNHLEPCQKWGRAYLEATRRALSP